MTSTIEPFVVLPGEGERLRGPVGGPARILARAETTNGGFTAIENEIPPDQDGPPDGSRSSTSGDAICLRLRLPASSALSARTSSRGGPAEIEVLADHLLERPRAPRHRRSHPTAM
jgi:hypothetical protein